MDTLLNVVRSWKQQEGAASTEIFARLHSAFPNVSPRTTLLQALDESATGSQTEPRSEAAAKDLQALREQTVMNQAMEAVEQADIQQDLELTVFLTSVAAQANVTEKLMEHEMAAKKSDESISNRSLTQFFAVASAVLQAVNSLHVETEARNAFVSSCVFELGNICRTMSLIVSISGQSQDAFTILSETFRHIVHGISSVCPKELDPSRILTPAHTAVLRVASRLNVTSQIVEMAGRMCHDALPGSLGMTEEEVLIYLSYAGEIAERRKQWEEAMQFYNLASTLGQRSSVAKSEVIGRCSLKSKLCALIIDGKTQLRPHQVYSTRIEPYDAIVSNAWSIQLGQLSSIIQETEEGLRRDGTLLVCRTIEEQTLYRQVRQLTKTHVTMTLAEISKNTSCGDVYQTEKTIKYMIDNRELSGKIDHSNEGLDRSVVTFEKNHDTKEEYKARFTDAIRESEGLIGTLRYLDVELNCSEGYMKLVQSK